MIYKLVSAGSLILGVITVLFTVYNIGPRIADDLLMALCFMVFGFAVGVLQLLREIRDGMAKVEEKVGNSG